MRLLNDYARSYRIMEPTTIADGEGGWSTKWREGTSFTGYLALDRSLAAQGGKGGGYEPLFRSGGSGGSYPL